MNSRRNIACDCCFKDSNLTELIREDGTIADCPWCGSKNVHLLPLFELGDLFRDVVSVYKPVEGFGGDEISFLLQEEWDIFDHKIEEDPELMQELTVAILEAGLGGKELFTDHPEYDGGFRREDSWLEEHWYEKADTFLSGKDPYGKDREVNAHPEPDTREAWPDYLEIAFEDLASSYEPNYILYRARIHKDRSRTEKLTISELGAPPAETAPAGRAPAGRANRSGHPVLYMASDENTAISEVRGWKGSAIALAEMRIRRKVWVVNLLDIAMPDSPFYRDSLAWDLQLAALFHRLSEDLSTPVMPHEEDKLYRPTQYLCEWIRRCNYDGLVYPSSLAPGHNVVLFNVDDTEPISVQYVRIKDVHYTFEYLKDHDNVYEEGPYDHLFPESPA